MAVAFALYTAKLTPSSSTVAPNGWGEPVKSLVFPPSGEIGRPFDEFTKLLIVEVISICLKTIFLIFVYQVLSFHYLLTTMGSSF